MTKSLKVIVDASHAIGSRYKDKSVGSFGDIVCASLNFTKTFGTYGDGGVIFVNDDALAQKISKLRTYGASRWADIHWNNDIIGTASRLGVFEAAVLNEKLPYLDGTITKQRENYFLYRDILKNINGLELPQEDSDYFINCYRLPVLTSRRDELADFLRKNGEKLHNFYPVPLPYLPTFKNLGYNKGDFRVAEKIARECLILPTNYLITKERARRIAELIKEFFF